MISNDALISVEVSEIWQELKKEPLCFWLLCGYLVFEYVRPQQIYTFIDIVPWSKFLVLGALIARLTATDKEVVYPSPMTKYFAGYTVAILFSSAFAAFPGISLENLNVALNWVIIYYLFLRIVTSRFRFFVITMLLMLASYKMSQHAAISWMSRGFAFSRWGVAGAPGYFGNAADVGVQMLLILPLAYIFFIECQSRWGTFKKIFFGFFPISVVLTIVAACERNTLLGLAFIGVVASITSKNKIKNLILIIFFAVVIFAIMPEQMFDRFSSSGNDETSVNRLMYWRRGLELFKSHPILGIGFDNWVSYLQRFHPDENFHGKVLVAHSTPITVLAELGALGFVFYYGIVVKIFILNLRSMKLARAQGGGLWMGIPYALNLGMVGYLIASVFLSITFYPFLFIQASLSAVLHNILTHQPLKR